MQDNDALIQVNDLGLVLEKREILRNISLNIHSDEILTIMGPNGAGKSCLLKCILGLIKPTAGQIIKPKNLKVGYTPQKILFEQSMPLSVEQFLKLGQPQNLDLLSALDEVGGQHLISSWMYRLSGGELQRVLLARALSQQPDLLVLDEPAAGVDITGQAEMYRLLARIRRNRHCGILVVSHDLSLVMAETDKVVCLNQHVCCSGRPEVVAKDPAFAQLFGMDAKGLALYTHHHDHSHDIEGHITPAKEPKDD